MIVMLWMQCYEYTDVNVVLWMPDGDDDLSGYKKFTGEQKLEDGKGINLSAINVGERDAKVKVESMLVSAIIVWEQDTR